MYEINKWRRLVAASDIIGGEVGCVISSIRERTGTAHRHTHYSVYNRSCGVWDGQSFLLEIPKISRSLCIFDKTSKLFILASRSIYEGITIDDWIFFFFPPRRFHGLSLHTERFFLFLKYLSIRWRNLSSGLRRRRRVKVSRLYVLVESLLHLAIRRPPPPPQSSITTTLSIRSLVPRPTVTFQLYNTHLFSIVSHARKASSRRLLSASSHCEPSHKSSYSKLLCYSDRNSVKFKVLWSFRYTCSAS